jgi:lipid II:glycine glycyltransferase (peptidoglycan interpeptide bridge formation enzyme)
LSNKEIYKNICSQRRDVPVFLQHWWMDAVCKSWNVAIAKKGDNITGVWPYPIEQKIGVSMIRTPMLTPYLGPHVFYPADIKESNTDSFEHDVISELIAQLPAAKMWHLALQPGIKQAGLFKEQGLEIDAKQTFLIDLMQAETALLANMKENMRRNIKAAENEISISDSPEHLADLYEYHKKTLANKKVSQPYSLADMQGIMDVCKANNACSLFVAKKGDAIQAIVWNIWDKTHSYYFMGSQNPASENYKAMTALLWHTIKKSKERGNIIFDLEGSMDVGVERFFRGFAGKRELYLVLRKNESLVWRIKEMIR